MPDGRYVWREIKLSARPVANQREIRAVDVAITAALLLAAAGVLVAVWRWM